MLPFHAMDWFDNLKEKLFGEPVKRSGQLHHGPLQRSEAFLQRYERWYSGTERERWLEHFREMFDRELVVQDTDLHLFSTAQATGMQLKRPRDADPEMLHFLQEEFKDQVIQEGYRVHLSDHRISPAGQHRERYYLKPEIAVAELKPPLPQRFGNVLIENWGDEAGKARHLKVLITVYSDRLYSPAESGMALINSLLTGRGRALR